MIKSLALLFFLFHILMIGFSQVLIDERFNDNEYGWPVLNNENCSTKISDGYYRMESKSGGWEFIIPMGLDPEKDFFIESTIILQQGQGSFGLVLKDYVNSKDVKEFAFIISPNGSYKIFVWNVAQNTTTIIKDWTKSTAIETELIKKNLLGINKRGKKISFFINGIEIFSNSEIQFSGAAVGYVLYDKAKVYADELSIKQDRGQVNFKPSPIKYKKENLGSGVNSIYEEIVPVISPDGNKIFFQVQDDPANIGNGDIWYAVKDSLGKWSKRQNLGFPLNNKDNNFLVSVLPDNNTLLIAGMYKMENGISRTYLGLSLSHQTVTGWSLPGEMKIINMYNYAAVNTYCISPNGKVLILAIEREDTHGYTDLYVSFLNADSTWSEPKNMGGVLNSFGEEATPHLGADGKTLYFSSDGLRGFGRHDIFLSKRLDDSWTKWSTPQNLGPDINSKNWDAYYSIPASGEYAYLVSSENSLGKNDIFQIKLQQENKTEPVVIIYGKVYDKSTNAPLGASISYHDLTSGKEAGIARSNSKDGSYKIILPYGEAYGFLAEKENYLSESDNIDLKEKKEFLEIRRDLYLSPMSAGKSILLNNVFFVRSKPDLLPDSYTELERLLDILLKNPKIKIEISGHTDNVGDPQKNKELSLERAKTIKMFLVSKGISSHRISEKGYGGTKPVASNSNEESRKLNRRVEFTVLE